MQISQGFDNTTGVKTSGWFVEIFSVRKQINGSSSTKFLRGAEFQFHEGVRTVLVSKDRPDFSTLQTIHQHVQILPVFEGAIEPKKGSSIRLESFNQVLAPASIRTATFRAYLTIKSQFDSSRMRFSDIICSCCRVSTM